MNMECPLLGGTQEMSNSRVHTRIIRRQKPPVRRTVTSGYSQKADKLHAKLTRDARVPLSIIITSEDN